MKTLGERVAERMRVLKMKQEDLALKIGVSQPSIQRIISGKVANPKKILALSKALRVSPEWLVNGDEYAVNHQQEADIVSGLTEEQKKLLVVMQGLTEKQQKALLEQAKAQSIKNKKQLEELSELLEKRA